MTIAHRSTLIVHGRLAMRESRLAAGRGARHGLQIMSFEQAAVRLAGGFVRPIDDESLRSAIQAAIPATPMGELESIKTLPGMIDAAADTLHKAWRAGIDLAARSADHPRLAAIARLEAAVLDQLPTAMMRPVDIVAAAMARIGHAPAVLGPVEITGLTELSPCWRPLLQALTDHIPVQWTAGPRGIPAWLEGMGVTIARAPAEAPEISAVSAATSYHEAVEAMRWARGLLASGVSPSEIAIATASPADYDDHFLALRADANIDLHFVHGIRTVATREGQAAAALADIVVRGLSQSRLRRLAALCRENAPFEALPDGWLRVLPADAPLSTDGAWNRLLTRLTPEHWPDGMDHAPALSAAVDVLAKGPDAASEIGEAFLSGRGLAIWRKALVAGPAASIDATLETLKQDDGLEACVSIAWMPASALAASPRRFVRLLGLNSSRWPRGIAEDRLIPDHIISTPVLDPLPVNLADRRDFETILATTADTVVLSRARRDSDGRLLGRSPLLAGHGDEIYLRRNAIPTHAFSETDRLMARPKEFATDPQAIGAQGCWRDWRQAEITPHDGLVRGDHPLVLAILSRTQSASSLRRLLRNPLSFVWVYAFGWREPQSSAEPLVLDALGIGDLVHMVLDRALHDLEAAGGLASADAQSIEVAVTQAVQAVAADWESERPVPPTVIWGRTLDDARVLAGRALSYGDALLPGTRSYGEVPFGGSEAKTETEAPWDTSTPVTIPDTGFNIAGYIDRIDISGDGTFTELAASELLSRVREFVADLSAGTIATELRVALPDGLSQAHRDNLTAASAAIDEITCSTIHGFCQRLIKPYPAEADIDPGAGVMDRNQADLTFLEIVDGWLRERLSGGQGGVLAEMVLHSPDETVALIHKIAENLRRRPTLTAPLVSPLEGHLTAFRQAVADFAGFLDGIAAVEPETVTIAEQLAEMATAVADGPDPATPAGLIRLLASRPHPDLCKKDGTFYSYRKKGKWAAAAKQAGLAKADGDRLNDAADAHYAACCESWISLVQTAAGHALAALMDEARPILQRYREHKRASAQLDFDDLIFAARDLLRDHDAVRRSLGQRFAHVLVDEFQDTDPLQTEIFWRLCGEPVDGEDDWPQFRIRPGALFLVGDPKQAIYRFRGADVGAYVQARDAFRDQNPDSLLSISTNFRSCGSILTFVNERFEAVLSADGQPGFTALDAFHEDRGGLCVAALDIAVADENGKASAEKQRDAEADAIAQLCAQLIESHPIIDRRSGAERPCLPGDIALLAPTGAELWRYEEALERRGIPVATQAGKGLFRRQEIQDLIALSRVLADRRDTLALGALLRGPIVGLTEEDLLDIIWGLPRTEEQPDRIPRLDLNVDPAAIAHPLARDIIERLQSLSRRVNSTTPHELLSQAVDVMRVRPLLLERHRGQAERALANVDLYLSLSTSYAVRGLRAFAEAMTAAWSDEARAVEGRPDAQEEAVALFTMHAAKGLEWPIVIPINTMTGVMAPESAVIDRQAETFYCPVLGVAPEGYETVRQAEKEELDRERIRLWYVAATRARELLVLPRLDITPSKSAWIGLVDLSLADLPALDASHLPAGFTTTAAGVANPQTRASFAAEAETIAAGQTRLTWLAPSRDESAAGRVLREEEPFLWTGSADDLPPELETTAQVTTFYISRFAPSGLRDSGVRFASYNAPVGRLASLRPGGYIEVPGGSLEVLERTVFHAEALPVGWDSLDTIFEADGQKTVTVTSLRRLLSERDAPADALDEIERMLKDAEVDDNVTIGRKRGIIDKMQLRDQAVLDEYQDAIFRLSLDSQLLILGPPGTGKTTTLIRRLGQKLDPHGLSDDEQSLIDASPSSLPHGQSWIMFTPTDLLGQYLKEAFSRNNVPAPDLRIKTWIGHRKELARNHLSILRTANGGGPFILKDSAATITPDAVQSPIEWFEQFQTKQNSDFWSGLEGAAAILSSATDAEIAKLGDRLRAAVQSAQTTSAASGIYALVSLSEDVRRVLGRVRADVDGVLKTALARAQAGARTQGENFFEQLIAFLDTLDDQTDQADDDLDDEEEEEEDRPTNKPAAAQRAYYAALRLQARSKARRRSASSRSALVLDWIGDRGLTDTEASGLAERLGWQLSLNRFSAPVRQYLSKVPARYRQFRRSERGGRWYPDGNPGRDLHPLEADLVILAMLRTGNALLADNRVRRNIDQSAYESLRALYDIQRNQILVDEAPDFSPVQLACMRALAIEPIGSFFACGDFNQRITDWGSRSEDSLRWVEPSLQIQRISIAYRQSRQLNDLAKALADPASGNQSDADLPEDVNNDAVSPVMASGLSEPEDVALWLSQRLSEIERSVSPRPLPSIAILVHEETAVRPITDALNAVIEDQNLHAVACVDGKIIGRDDEIRVFDVRHIKGLEFEAVFFVGVDRLAASEPSLFERYLYVGATRAATYLGMCADDEIPPSLARLSDHFGQRW